MNTQVFYHIASANPMQAQQLCNKYNYNCDNEEQAAGALCEIADMGDAELKEVMSIHPDKEILVALFSNNTDNFLPSRRFVNFNGDSDCGCGSCSGCGGGRRVNLNDMFMRTNQADGSISSTTTAAPNSSMIVGMQTNTLIFVGILSLIGVAIYLKNK